MLHTLVVFSLSQLQSFAKIIAFYSFSTGLNNVYELFQHPVDVKKKKIN